MQHFGPDKSESTKYQIRLKSSISMGGRPIDCFFFVNVAKIRVEKLGSYYVVCMGQCLRTVT